MPTNQQSTGTETAAFQAARAYRADLRQVLIQLEDVLASPAPGRVGDWSRGLHEVLIDVAASFERHIGVTEGEGGLLAEIAEHSPRLANAIQRLRVEHGQIRERLSRALIDVRGLQQADDTDQAEHLREQVMRLLAVLVRHRQHGADLVYEAYTVDIGGSG